jgi:TRAP-type mannitol/chloroaromatic compound transport system permease small subunit
MFEKISQYIDYISAIAGKLSGWITSLLVIIICSDVFMRYVFNTTKTWVIELEWHLFGLVFLLGAAYTFQKDRHVRVDLFYSKFSTKTKNWIDLLGTLLFLLPWCFVIIISAWDYAANSFYFREGSPNPGGLPARYVIKFAICMGFALLLLQAFSLIIKILISHFSYDFDESQNS